MKTSNAQEPELKQRILADCSVQEIQTGYWRLSLLAGEKDQYRWAQLDDYWSLSRSNFLWNAPSVLTLDARVSDPAIPGTWGFGFWNDPFNASLGVGGTTHRLPAFPDAAWFFYASPPNYLAFSDNHPAQGMLAATFSSRKIPAPLYILSVPFLPFLTIPFIARWMRRVASRFIKEDSKKLEFDVTAWHKYRLDWRLNNVKFYLDDQLVFDTPVSPRQNLGLVLWIDNQFASFPSNGKLRFGRLESTKPAWMELKEIRVASPS
jgi:hypothetical protein